MPYDDYLIRMFRQYGAVLARIIGLKKSGDYIDVLIEIDQNLEKLFGLDTHILRLLDDESLYRKLSTNEQLNVALIELIADLFKEEGEILKLQSKYSESDNAYSRSLYFYLKIENIKEPSQPIEVSQKIDEVLHNIEFTNVLSTTLFELFCYLENMGNFKKADDILILLSTRPESKNDAISEMKSFYNRLLEIELIELSSHGMSREYVQGKLRELNTAQPGAAADLAFGKESS